VVLDTSREIKAMIRGGGKRLFYTESGRLLNLLDIDSALKSGRVIGGQIFIKRVREVAGGSVSGPATKPLSFVPKVVPSSDFSLKENPTQGIKKEPDVLGGSLSGAWFKGGTVIQGVMRSSIYRHSCSCKLVEAVAWERK
jgi:hypothetical protein